MSRHIALASPRVARGSALLAALTVAVLCVVSQLAPSTSAGYSAKITNTTDTAATAGNFTCLGALAADKTSEALSYPLNEAATTTTAADKGNAGTNTATYRGTHAISSTTPLACSRDTASATLFDGSTSYVSTTTSYSSPATFSLEVWFKTTMASGKLIGFGNAQTGASSSYDRQLYVNTTGALTFGTYSSGYQTITSPSAYNNGAWHQAVVTMSASIGMAMWVDGTKVASNAAFVSAEANTGYWKIGYDTNSGWPLAGANPYFTGSMRFVSVFTTVLSATQIANHYAAGR